MDDVTHPAPVKESTLKEHEKFWAFIGLIVLIAALATLASFMRDPVPEDPNSALAFTSRVRILDLVCGGLLTIAGQAAGALFKFSTTERDLAAAARASAEKVPPPTGEAREVLEHEYYSHTTGGSGLGAEGTGGLGDSADPLLHTSRSVDGVDPVDEFERRDGDKP